MMSDEFIAFSPDFFNPPIPCVYKIYKVYKERPSVKACDC
jgi:hypothetical protein